QRDAGNSYPAASLGARRESGASRRPGGLFLLHDMPPLRKMSASSVSCAVGSRPSSARTEQSDMSAADVSNRKQCNAGPYSNGESASPPDDLRGSLRRG